MRRYIYIVLFLATSIASWAVPATPKPIVRVLADGSRDTTYLYGDEYGSYRTDKIGRLLSPQRIMNRAPQRQMLSSYVPSTGKVRIPVILVNFKDYNFTLPDAVNQFNDLFNGKGGSNPNATGSVHEYYVASSDSALDLQYEVFGIYTLSHEMEYYGENNKNSRGDVTSHNKRARDLVLEAVRLAIDNGVDLSPYDNNGDGTIDNVSIVVAGYNEAEGGEERTIWPHYSSISSSNKFSGKTLSGYLMISEYRSSGGKVQAGIGTYCHEFGHALGLPDLYNTSDGSIYTVGTWDIMCSGSYNNDGSTPPTFTAFERFMMGWLTPLQVKSGMQVLEPIESSNKALLIAKDSSNLKNFNPSPSEYFLLENRQLEGWDANKEALVATGLLVTHITFNKTKWDNNTFNNNEPLGFAIVSAGMSQQTKSSAADVFPGTTKRTSWLPTLNDGTLLADLHVSQIRQRNDGYVTFQVGSGGKAKLAFDRESVELETTYLYNAEEYDTAQIKLNIDSLEADTVLLFISTQNFEFSADNGKSWYTGGDTLAITVTQDSTYSIPLLAVHTPPRKNCNYLYSFLTAESIDFSEAAQMTLAGRAPRPTLITTPVIDSVKNISTNSFSIYWQEQDDAEEYYYTLYTLSEGECEESEALDVEFSKTGEWIETTRTIYAPDKISMLLNNTYTPNSTDETIGGDIQILGSKDGEQWEKVSTFRVHRTTKNVVKEIEVDTAKQWRTFRLNYTHVGGAGGVQIADFRSHYPMKINYVDSLFKYTIYAPSGEAVFRELRPNTTYYYSMLAYESKGCEPHYSALSEPRAIKTKPENTDPKLIVTRSDDGVYTVTLPEMADGLHTLGIYDRNGALIYQLKPAYGDTEIILPKLPVWQVYTLKYYSSKMKRKDLSGKLISF